MIKDQRITEDQLDLMHIIEKDSNASQRLISQNSGFSIGKVNYCLKALKEKGLVKIENFQKNSNKMIYFHVLTPKGLATKTRLTINFMKKKFKEYDDLKKDIEKTNR